MEALDEYLPARRSELTPGATPPAAALPDPLGLTLMHCPNPRACDLHMSVKACNTACYAIVCGPLFAPVSSYDVIIKPRQQAVTAPSIVTLMTERERGRVGVLRGLRARSGFSNVEVFRKYLVGPAAHPCPPACLCVPHRPRATALCAPAPSLPAPAEPPAAPSTASLNGLCIWLTCAHRAPVVPAARAPV